jgi:hypothetical protein
MNFSSETSVIFRGWYRDLNIDAMDLSGRQILIKSPLIFCILLLLLEATAQNTTGSCQAPEEKKPSNADESVAAAARSSKNQKAHAKKVF